MALNRLSLNILSTFCPLKPVPEETFKLNNALNCWGSNSFDSVFKDELKHAQSGTIPLHQGTSQGGIVDDNNISVLILNSDEVDDFIKIKTGIFFNEIIGGCNCHDDPVSENSYCEMEISINKKTAEVKFTLLNE